MPSADIPVVAALLQPDRYLVTPAPNGSDAAWLEDLEAALTAGIRRVQLRAPHCPSTRWTSLVEAAVDACRRHGAEVLVNGDVALAQALDIGVHLRSTQLAALDARPLPKEQRVGASCHTLEDLRRAEAIGCDFAVLGPIAATGMGWVRGDARRSRTPDLRDRRHAHRRHRPRARTWRAGHRGDPRLAGQRLIAASAR
jgi:8-oxo-dGTP diphosphatase